MASGLSPQLASIEKEVQGIFKTLSVGFQKLDKIKDVSKQSKQLEELTAKMREAKRFIKDFHKEMKEEEAKNTPETNKLLNEKKQSLIKDLNSYVALRKTYTSSLGSKQELLDGGSYGPSRDVDARMTSNVLRTTTAMSKPELGETGRKQMDETDQTNERSKKVAEDTSNIGTETTVIVKEQTEQPGTSSNEQDTTQSSFKNASQFARAIGNKLATDRCIMFFLFLIVSGVIAIIVVTVFPPPMSLRVGALAAEGFKIPNEHKKPRFAFLLSEPECLQTFQIIHSSKQSIQLPGYSTPPGSRRLLM